MRGTYVVGVAAFYGVLAFDFLVLRPLLLDLAADFDIPLLTTLTITTVAYLPMALRARILGAMCEPYLKAL
jgi:hypothetical protein